MTASIVERLRKRYVMSMFATQAILYDTMNAERREAADLIEQLTAEAVSRNQLVDEQAKEIVVLHLTNAEHINVRCKYVNEIEQLKALAKKMAVTLNGIANSIAAEDYKIRLAKEALSAYRELIKE